MAANIPFSRLYSAISGASSEGYPINLPKAAAVVFLSEFNLPTARSEIS